MPAITFVPKLSTLTCLAFTEPDQKVSLDDVRAFLKEHAAQEPESICALSDGSFTVKMPGTEYAMMVQPGMVLAVSDDGQLYGMAPQLLELFFRQPAAEPAADVVVSD